MKDGQCPVFQMTQLLEKYVGPPLHQNLRQSNALI